jgi:hypothetical protein
MGAAVEVEVEREAAVPWPPAAIGIRNHCDVLESVHSLYKGGDYPVRGEAAKLEPPSDEEVADTRENATKTGLGVSGGVAEIVMDARAAFGLEKDAPLPVEDNERVFKNQSVGTLRGRFRGGP